MLRAALNVHWSQRVTNKELYSDLPKIIVGSNFQDTYGDMMKKLRTTCFFGCQQMEETKRGRSQKTYIHQLIEDTGLQMEKRKILMVNREQWKSFIHSSFSTRFDL